MAKPIVFTPKSVDPKLELQKRLEAAPTQHAEALLVAYDLLEEAHRQGVLDSLHGAIRARDTIMKQLAEYGAEPVSVNALRNLLAMSKLLGALDPEPISQFSKEFSEEMERHRRERDDKPPSLWAIFKSMRRPEARRGLALVTSMLAALGRASK